MTNLNHRAHTMELAGSDERSVQASNLLLNESRESLLNITKSVSALPYLKPNRPRFDQTMAPFQQKNS
jgi:hypothetical protein